MTYQDRYPLQEYAQRSVLTTWKMSYEQVRTVEPSGVARYAAGWRLDERLSTRAISAHVEPTAHSANQKGEDATSAPLHPAALGADFELKDSRDSPAA